MDISDFEMAFEARPAWLKKFEVEKGVVVVGEKPYPYTVCRKELQTSIPFFVGFVDKQHLFISEEVPPSDRPVYLAHEVREFTDEAFVGKEGRCAKGVARELEDVSESERPVYIARRTKMFEGLVAYYKTVVAGEKDPVARQPHEELLSEITESLKYLQSFEK